MAVASFVAGEMDVTDGTRRPLLVDAGNDAIAPFDWVYKNGSVYEIADNTTLAKSNAAGIAITKCAADGKFVMINSGSFKVTTPTFDADEMYTLSTARGKMEPDSDKATSDYMTSLGRAISTTEFVIDIKSYGYQAA